MGSSQSTEHEKDEQQQEEASQQQQPQHDPAADPVFLSSSFISAYQKSDHANNAGPTRANISSRQFTTSSGIDSRNQTLRQPERQPGNIPEFVFPKFQYGDETYQQHPAEREADGDYERRAPEDIELEIDERLTDRFYQEQLKIARQQLEKLETKLQK